ncbi:MAG: SUMF1/EgtB/PvdO family nonheme iron enzyme, partial [Phycisphaerae bacterium]|nr:SUMF1/EgtB/PvdO family nonheme iron enzyme [Phycisphaerae bacterium]
MRYARFAVVLAAVVLAAGTASADVFGTGANQFTIDFVPITGDASSANGTSIGGTATFVDPDDFYMGTYEITAGQWNKFIAMAGAPTGNPLSGYNATTGGTGLTAGANLSALEAFQFVNWLNTSTGNHAAYKFVETTPGDPATLTFQAWDAADADGTNLFRHKDAWYFLPTEDEWVKAAHWTGSTLQLHATSDNRVP